MLYCPAYSPVVPPKGEYVVEDNNPWPRDRRQEDHLAMDAPGQRLLCGERAEHGEYKVWPGIRDSWIPAASYASIYIYIYLFCNYICIYSPN